MSHSRSIGFPSTECDVTVIGGGLAGKAAASQLAQAGLKVICIEPVETERQPVGESLDWSAPELLKALGLPMEQLIARRIATWKKHVTVRLRDGSFEHYVPTARLADAPFHIELRTLHVDRVLLDQELLKIALDHGVTMVRDRVVEVDRRGKRISAVRTVAGEQFSSPWFIDASGFATSLLAREFALRSFQFGPAKVAMWTYFPQSQQVEGTTLYFDPNPSQYLDWTWEIPISSEVVSVGYITTGSRVKVKRGQGLSVEQIFQQHLAQFPRFREIPEARVSTSLNVTSFRSRVFVGTAGPNWFITGEAASMVDPITANGVTAALRHAAEASRLILKNRQSGKVGWLARLAYSSRIVQMAKFFNIGIEKVVFDTPIRNRIGVRTAGTVYTSPAWSMNVVYARLNPKGILSTSFLNLFLGFFRASAWVFYFLCKRLPQTAEAAS